MWRSSGKFVVAWIAGLLVRLLVLTLRIRFVDNVGILRNPHQPPLLWLMWHNRLFLMPALRAKMFPHRKGTALTSASKDGDWIAAFMSVFGIGAIRGSSSRRGMKAVFEMLAAAGDGDLAITPDGPRGPRYHLNPGALLIAQRAGLPIAPIGVEFSRAWRTTGWDGFFIPKPFAKVVITLDKPFHVVQTPTDEAFEAERQRLETAMRALVIQH